jgi:hypothetical protein
VRNSFQIGGRRRSQVEEAEPTLRRWIQTEPRLTLEQLRERLAAQGIAISVGALWYLLNEWSLTFNKTLHASEQEREDVRAARLEWNEAKPTMDVGRLVFIDETGTATNMTRSYGRAPKNCRCIDSAPLGDWQTTTFIAGPRQHQLTARMVIDGPMDGELCVAWAEQFRCPQPTLSPERGLIARREHRFQPGYDVRLGDDHRRDVDAGCLLRCGASCSPALTSRRMKLRSMCRRTKAATQTIKLTSGSTERRAA